LLPVSGVSRIQGPELLRDSILLFRNLRLGTWRSVAMVAVVLGLGAVAPAGPGSRADEVSLPTVVSPADTELYRQIFDVQEDGDWHRADALIKRLDDKLLLGHVMAQRYLHPTKYRSHYKELRDWLADYADHPQATQLHQLALRRKPASWKAPTAPERVRAQTIGQPKYRAYRQIPSKSLNATDRSKARHIRSYVANALRRGHTLTAKRALETRDAARVFSNAEYDKLAADLAFGYFTDGQDKMAQHWAGQAAKRSGNLVPEAHWTAGLVFWRQGDKDRAAYHFEEAARHSTDTDWFHSGAAFWAARAYLVTRQPEKVNAWLAVAAERPRTFYGLLARHILGKPMEFRWTPPPLVDGTLEALMAAPRGKRAMALLQVGEVAEAERELRELARGATDTLANGILALAARGNMAGLAVRLDAELYPNGGGYDGAAYPIPAWVPAEGFRVDRALIYALIRQESRFNPNAKSWAGARGLMQLMPGTAAFVAQTGGIKYRNRGKLYQPEMNLTLGQRYIEMLLRDGKIQGDLFLMAAAWNGGPGNLNKWRKRTDDLGDPLFLIESLPSQETREFIERVLANLWIYRHRLGQEMPSLDAIAAGQRPVYQALGPDSNEVAEGNGSRK
jgi:soluble lytic murein transglycosylase